VEKPVSHNVWEGRKIVEAARKYRKIVQTGTQSRSSSGIAEAIEWLKEGHIGGIRVARGLCYKPRGSIGKVEGVQPIPESINYDLWCGPAPKAPLRRRQLHYDWHWVWDTGNGDLGNQGIHQMDIARWFLGENALSPRVFSVGGRLGYVDDGETPNTQFVYHDYKVPLIFEVRGLPERRHSKRMDKYPRENGGSVAVIIECEGGHVLVPDYNAAVFFDANGTKIKEFRGSTNHHASFVKAVRSRLHTDLTADILEGHLSSALCHTGNISHRVGRKASVEEARDAFKGNPEAMDTFNRMAAHLAANEIDLDVERLTLGAFLKMDPRTEQFTNNRQANTLLARDYRAPFIVPTQV
jgi:hypothetical protein